MARTVPAVATPVPGNFLTAALWTAQVSATMQYLMGSGTNGVPRFRGYASTTQTITNNTWTTLNIDTEVYDSDNGHSTVTNTSRYTVQVAGIYLCTGTVGYAANATANRAIRFSVNGVAIPGSFVKCAPADTSGSTGLATVTQVVCVVGDYIEVMANQNSGGNLLTAAAGDVAPSLAVQWISG